MDHRVRSRRRLIQAGAALAGLVVLAACGPGRSARMPNVGFLAADRSGADQVSKPFDDAFRDGLHELGYVEGQTVTIQWTFADERLPAMAAAAAELVRLQPDVIVVRGEIAAKAARAATSTIPIVIALSSDPVGSGLVNSLAQPGGNVTGLTALAPQLAGKRLELLKAAVPELSRVAAFTTPSVSAHVREFRETEAAARTLGVQLQALEMSRPEDFEAAVAAAVAERAEAMLVFAGGLNSSLQSRIVEFAARQRLPAMYALREHAQAGGLMAYGPNYIDMHRRAAVYVDKILKGARPADLPMEQPTAFDFVINLKTAQALGLTIPPSVLQQATEVIQ